MEGMLVMPNELSEKSIDDTIQILLRHCKNKEKFRKDANQIATNGEDHKDYTNKGIKRSRVSGKKYIHSIFKNSAAAGSNFYACVFDNNIPTCSYFARHCKVMVIIAINII